MNNKIEDFLAQCSDDITAKPWPLVDQKKFARLILEDCLEVLEDKISDDGSSYFEEDSNRWVTGYKRGVNDCISSINSYLASLSTNPKEQVK